MEVAKDIEVADDGGQPILAGQKLSDVDTRASETGRTPGRFMTYAYWGNTVPSACKYYRIDMPFRGLGEASLADACIDANSKGTNSLGLLLEADVNLWYAQGAGGAHKMAKFVREEGAKQVRVKYPEYIPPTIIYDIDDNIDWVHPFNPAYEFLGTRDLSGTLLVPDSKVISRDFQGNEHVLWEDGKTVFDNSGVGHGFNVRKNQALLQQNRAFAGEIADGATVPSPHLAEYLKEHWNVKHVYVYPNSICPEDWFMDCEVKNDKYAGKTTILWQGGDSHYQDLYAIRNGLAEIAKKYPNVHFIFWGAHFPAVYKDIPTDMYTLEPWVGYDAYKLKRIFLRSDINLCPLVDNEFNRSKSAIKWYEASILKNPEATLAQRTSPFKDEIKDGETGILFDSVEDFVPKLGKLIEDAELRKTLGENSKKWVLENRHYAQTVKGLFEFYLECRARTKFNAE